jgi:hypothetical protein
MDHKKIIESLGGYVAVANDLERHPTTVFKWQAGGIPARHWPEIMQLAKRMGSQEISYEELAAGRKL